MAPSTMPREDRARAQHLEAVIEHADLAELVEADGRRIGAGRAERAVDQKSCPRPRCSESSASTTAGAWRCGVSWNACAPISMPM